MNGKKTMTKDETIKDLKDRISRLNDIQVELMKGHLNIYEFNAFVNFCKDPKYYEMLYSMWQQKINYIKELEEKLKIANKRLEWLELLEEAGVDNWQGIDEAIRIREERNKNNENQ